MHDPADRLNRLEEAVGFTQHDLEELSRQVRDLFEQVGRLNKRLDSMDRRVDAMASPPDDEPDPAG